MATASTQLPSGHTAPLAFPTVSTEATLLNVSLTGPPSDRGSSNTRVTAILHWLQKQQWSTIPFDKLVLKLDSLGVELSIAEQDMLKQCLQHPGTWPTRDLSHDAQIT